MESIEQRITLLVAQAVEERLHQLVAELNASRMKEALLLDLVDASRRLLGNLKSVAAVQALADAVQAAEGPVMSVDSVIPGLKLARPSGLTAEQKALRLTGIGASETAAILGISPWARPIDVYRAKVEGLELEETVAMKRGRLLEDGIAQWYAEDTGATLRPGVTTRHPTCKVLLATPDRFALHRNGEDKGLECKAPGIHMASAWGESGSDQVPPYYVTQVETQMACCNLQDADVAALLGGEDFRVYHLRRDAELEAMIIEWAEKFWRDFIINKTPPPPDASEPYTEWLHKRYPEVSARAPILWADADAHQWAAQLFDARKRKDAAEKDEQLARQHLEARIGSGYGIEGETWKILWAESKGRETTNWEAVVAEAGIPRALIAKYTKRTPHRVFKPTIKKAGAP